MTKISVIKSTQVYRMWHKKWQISLIISLSYCTTRGFVDLLETNFLNDFGMNLSPSDLRPLTCPMVRGDMPVSSSFLTSSLKNIFLS